MELKEILRLMAEKYPSEHSLFTKLQLWDDGSGVVYRSISGDYGWMSKESNVLIEFNSIDELIEHLQEK